MWRLRTCHGLVNNNAGEMLYFHAQHDVAQHFQTIRERDLARQHSVPLILALSKLWPEIHLVAVMVKDILLYLVPLLLLFGTSREILKKE